MVNGEVSIPVATVNDGNLHRFSIEQDGVSIRIIVIRRPDQSLVAAFDACEICGNQGYYQKGPNVICKNCASAIFIPSIGVRGGCNPIPLESARRGRPIGDPRRLNLLPGVKMFRNPSSADMFLRFVSQSIRRAPRRKAMTVAAVAMGSAVATAMLGVMLDIGDRVNRELRGLGANLMVTPKAALAAGRDRRHQLSPGVARRFHSRSAGAQDQVHLLAAEYHRLCALAQSRNRCSTGAMCRSKASGSGAGIAEPDGAPLEAGLRTVNSDLESGRPLDRRSRAQRRRARSHAGRRAGAQARR